MNLTSLFGISIYGGRMLVALAFIAWQSVARPVPPEGYEYERLGKVLREMTRPDPQLTPTLSRVAECQENGGDAMTCYVKASPERCKQAAVDMVGNPSMWKRTWLLCVKSCADAGLYDRVIGDCRK